MKTLALIVFIAVYALLLLLPKYRAVVALVAAALFVAVGIVPFSAVAAVVAAVVVTVAAVDADVAVAAAPVTSAVAAV